PPLDRAVGVRDAPRLARVRHPHLEGTASTQTVSGGDDQLLSLPVVAGLLAVDGQRGDGRAAEVEVEAAQPFAGGRLDPDDRTELNVAIVLLLAVPIAFLPGGGNAADALLTALTLAFLATLVLAARQLYRENRLTVDTLPDGERAVLLGAVGVLVLMIAGADE